MAPTNSYGQEMVSIYLIKIKITTKFFNLTLDPSFKVKRGHPNLKVLITRLLLIPELCNVKPTKRKSLAGNLLMWSHLTLDPSFNVKRGHPNLKVLVTSGILCLYVFYYCFYWFAMFGDTLLARNKASGIILVASRASKYENNLKKIMASESCI